MGVNELHQIWSLLADAGLKGAAQTAGLLFVRLLPILTLTPVFGGESMPRRLRTGIAILFTIGFLPGFQSTFGQTVPWTHYTLLLVKEAAVGLTMAFFLLILFEAVASVGELLDLARGATLANVLDPLTQNQQSVLGVFLTQLAVVLFLSIGGVQLLFRALGDSFVLLRPHDLLPAAVFAPNAAGSAINLVADLFVLAFRLAAPAVVVIFLLDLALGVVNRVAPQIQVYFLSMTTKGTVGLVMLLIAFGFTVDLMIEHFGVILRALRDWTAATH